MANMVGCEDQTSKAYMDNKFADLSRVYPTEDLADLFQEFPNGFRVSQARTFIRNGQRLSLEIEVSGNPSTREIKGKATLSDAAYRSVLDFVLLEEARIRYEQGKMILEDSTDYLAEYLSDFRFMFQEVTFNKEVLQQLTMRTAQVSQTGTYMVSYDLDNEYVQKTLGLTDSRLRLSLRIIGASDGDGQYFRNITFGEPIDNEQRSSIIEYISDNYVEVE